MGAFGGWAVHPPDAAGQAQWDREFESGLLELDQRFEFILLQRRVGPPHARIALLIEPARIDTGVC
jgi:hypothetical protein